MVSAPQTTGATSLRIVYFGTPEFAVPTLTHLIQSRHTVCGVVTQPDRPSGRGQKVSEGPVKQAARAHGLPVYQPDRLREQQAVETIALWQPHLGVVAAYGKLIPDELLRLPPLGMINVHASLLPKYRGAAPVHRAIIDGATETGITIMRMVKALDAGNMLAKVTRPIGPDETSDLVEHDLARLGAPLLLDVVEQIVTGTVQEEPQDDSLSSYAARLRKEEGLVDWALPGLAIHNRVRGLYPWPHAYSHLDGSRVILLKTRVEPALAEDTAGHGGERTTEPPGTIVDVTRDAIHVATGHGGRIAIERLQPEGRRAMNARDFLASRPLKPGTRFGAT